MADFRRDIHSLLALGFKAPQIQDIIQAVDNHPNVYFDGVILDKYRRAIEAALLAFYWKDPAYLKGFNTYKNTDPNKVPLKGDIIIPIRPLETDRHSDDTARDYSIAGLPPEIIASLSKYNQDILYELTRKTPPVLVKSIFRFPRKPDLNRITLVQDEILRRLRKAP